MAALLSDTIRGKPRPMSPSWLNQSLSAMTLEQADLVTRYLATWQAEKDAEDALISARKRLSRIRAEIRRLSQ